jgi:uncharacterized protein
MSCPACGRALTTQTAGEVTVDVCSGGCGGIWFDNFELPKLEYSADSAGEALLDEPVDPTLVVDRTRRYSCPKCDPPPVMMRHFESVERKVTIDQCPNCNGVWLDAGELRTIRSEYSSEQERQAAGDAYFDQLFGAQIKAIEAEDHAEAAKAQKFAHAFRFICPSTYVPGKQDWGPF